MQYSQNHLFSRARKQTSVKMNIENDRILNSHEIFVPVENKAIKLMTSNLSGKPK